MSLKSLLFPVLAAALIALANFSPNPPSGPCDSPFVGGHTGAPGESNCTGCHGGTANTGPGSLGLSLSDTTLLYSPGEWLDAKVTIRQMGIDKFGFVGLALKDSDNSTIGTFTIDDLVNTRTYSDGPRNYVSHTPCGADAIPPDSLSWTFHWQAPATNAGAITIYLAGLAANHNHALTGDHTYTLTVHLMPDSTTLAIKDHNSVSLVHVWPNPVSNIIYFTMGDEGKNALAHHTEIWSVDGRLLHSILVTQNELLVPELATGFYLLRVIDKNGAVVGQTQFVKY